MLATLGEVLSGTAAGEQRAKGGHAKGGWGAGLSRLAVHHTRDTLCAGPHASGKLRLGFAALLERLVQHLEVLPLPLTLTPTPTPNPNPNPNPDPALRPCDCA